MTTEPLLSFTEIRRLAEPTLARLPDAEVASAVDWLQKHVMKCQNVSAQVVLLQSWQETWDRRLENTLQSA